MKESDILELIKGVQEVIQKHGEILNQLVDDNLNLKKRIEVLEAVTE